MKTYNEMANDVLRRIKENNEIKAKKRKMYVRYATSFASILIVAVLGISVWYNLKPAIVSDREVNSESGMVNDLISNDQSGTESENEVQNSVIIDDEATLKRVYFYPDQQKLILSPENPRYAPLVYVGGELESIKIIGKAVAFQSAIV